ncbi:MAG TPA: hypothetical protein VMT19_12965 [Thermoanaerobaculaceae bacterium]|nr:hypothetical protein [Thermoanaerobaculaceae bacterium]
MAERNPPLAADLELRRSVLARAGARGGEFGELLAYNRSGGERNGPGALPAFPLADEPHLEAWRAYAADAATRGAWAALRDRLPQLRFPIEAGMSERSDYRDATRRGVPAGEGTGPGLKLADPERLELLLHEAIAGTVPLIVAAARADFVSLVQALCHRNEPKTVPDSMGACIVAGYNNWDRIHSHRRRWEADHQGAATESWLSEFQRLQANKPLYQDRFIVLSRGPYSNVRGSEAGFDEAEWLRHSLRIRREHECTHYFTLRVFGALQNNLLEELIADFVGVVSAFGEFRSDLALLFLGLEGFPAVRPGGRICNYRGTPPLSDGAFAVLARLASDGVRNLGRVAATRPDVLRGRGDLARLVCALTLLTMEELAADGAAERIVARLAEYPRATADDGGDPGRRPSGGARRDDADTGNSGP